MATYSYSDAVDTYNTARQAATDDQVSKMARFSTDSTSGYSAAAPVTTAQSREATANQAFSNTIADRLATLSSAYYDPYMPQTDAWTTATESAEQTTPQYQPSAYGKLANYNNLPTPAASLGVQNMITSGVTSDSAQQTQQYLNDYNANREQKIRDMYANNIAAQNAAQKTAYDRNANALKTAYDNNLGTLKTAYDNNLGTLKANYDSNLANLRTAYDNNTGSLRTAYDANTGTLRTAYDKNLGSLRNAYDQNLSDAEAYRAGISPRYQDAMNALAAENERQRRNTNMQGAVNGLNTGAGSQLALGQSMAYQGNLGNLSRSEVEALNEAERGINDLNRTYQNNYNMLETEYNNNLANLDKQYANELDRLGREYNNNQNTFSTNYNNALNKLQTEYSNNQNNYATNYQNSLADIQVNYQNKIAEAAANNDYQMAAALLDEYGAQYDRMMDQASQLAQFGDFSMYANIYGVDAALSMEKQWVLQNPDLAYNLGKITDEDYYLLTGAYPTGANGGFFGTGNYLLDLDMYLNGQYDMNEYAMSRGYSTHRGRGSGSILLGDNNGNNSRKKKSTGRRGRGIDYAYRGPAGYYDGYGNFVQGTPDNPGKVYGSAKYEQDAGQGVYGESMTQAQKDWYRENR